MRRSAKNLVPGDTAIDPNGRLVNVTKVEPSTLFVEGASTPTVIVRGTDADNRSYARTEQRESRWLVIRK